MGLSTTALDIVNRALLLLGESPRAVTRVVSGATYTAPNGGTANNAGDDSTATEVLSTADIGTTSPYVLLQVDYGSVRDDLAYLKLVGLRLSAGTSRQFYVQGSLDGVRWENLGGPLTLVDTSDRAYWRSVLRPLRYVRVARVGSADLSTGRAAIDDLNAYYLGTNDADQTVRALYPLLRDRVLAAHRWRCTMRKATLTELTTETPLNEWEKTWALPEDLLVGPLAVYDEPGDNALPHQSYEIFQGRLLSDRYYSSGGSNYAYVDYQVRADESEWPPHLEQLMTYALAAELAEPMTEQTTKADYFQRLAFGGDVDQGRGGLFRHARQLESTFKAPEALFDFSLTMVR